MAETNYQKPIELPYLRLRFHLVNYRGYPQEFLVQLEYNRSLVSSGPNKWGPVARFDHSPDNEHGHDVREEGLHLDLYNVTGDKYDVKRNFPFVHIERCPEWCEGFLIEKADQLVYDYEQRNEISGGYYTR